MKGLWGRHSGDSDEEDAGLCEEGEAQGGECVRTPNGGEVITLACGHLAGYTVAHFYNTQLASALAARDEHQRRLQAAQPGRTFVAPRPVLSDALFAPTRESAEYAAAPRAVFVDLHGACFAPSVHPVAAAPHIDRTLGATVPPSAQRVFAAWSGRVTALSGLPPALAARDPETAAYVRNILAAAAASTTTTTATTTATTGGARPVAPVASAGSGAAVSAVLQRPESWGDVLGCGVFPESLCEVRGVTHGADAWGAWDDAADATASSTRGVRAAVREAVRRHAERCDRVCGLQLVADADSAFAAVAEALLADIRDEYARSTPVVALGTAALLAPTPAALADVPPTASASSSSLQRATRLAQRRLCCALAAATWAEHADLVVPLSAGLGPATVAPRSDERACLERAAVFALALHGLARPYATPPPECGAAPAGTLADVVATFQPARFASTVVSTRDAACADASPRYAVRTLTPFASDRARAPQEQEQERAYAVCAARFGAAVRECAVAPAARTRLWDVAGAVAVPASMQGVCAPAAVGALALAAETRADAAAAACLAGLAGALQPYRRGAARPVGFEQMGGRTVADLDNALQDLCAAQKYVLQ